jgi:hypothetical protein
MTTTGSVAGALWPDAASFIHDAARDSSESRSFRARAGQQVWIGFRNLHVLPTPISIVRLQAPTADTKDALTRTPLLRELTSRMQIRPVVLSNTAAVGASLRGLPVVPLRAGDMQAVIDLLARGARQVLALPADSCEVKRMLIVAEPVAVARDSALSVAASIARHLDVDATMLLRSSNFPRRAARYKELLDLRNDSLRRHGLDFRTASYTGNLHDAMTGTLTGTLTGLRDVLLVAGLGSPVRSSRLCRDLEALLTRAMPAGLLLVAGRAQRSARPIDAGAFAAAR